MTNLRTVLVIDDDPDIRDLVQLGLEDEGYRVLTAPHGQAALELLGRSPVDLILLDMRMPVMDGWTFARVYRQQTASRVPIVVVTAAQDAASRSAEIAAEGHIAKPFGLAELRATVEQHIHLRALRILVVDDEEHLARLAVQLLSPPGHRVSVATSGEQGLELLQREPFDLVVSDVGMGAGMNGWELADQVRTRYPKIRVILATGWGVAISDQEAAAHGVAAVVAKPYRAAELRDLVARLAAD